MTFLGLSSSRVRASVLAGVAGSLGLMGAVEVTTAQTPGILKPVAAPVVAQQLVTLPEQPVSFVV
jgi:hypothetical protein